MAITKGQREHLLKLHVCRKYRIDPARYIDMEESLIDLSVTLAFRPIPASDGMRAAMAAMRKSIEDEFRREVLKASAPEAYARICAVITAFDQSHENFFVKLEYSDIRDIERETISHPASRNSSIWPTGA